MTFLWRCWFWHLGLTSLLAMGGAIASSRDCALAQITPDGTLGAESSVVTPNVDINGITSERIDGGAIRGANIFHSFQEFNIDEGRGAYFTNPAAIANILARVTGNDPSDILGKLGVLGNANLFLINPNGIIFGPNARLDVAGSFVASTANSLVFGNGFEFSANNPEALPLLTMNVPLGLQYGSNQPGSIVNAGNLAVGLEQNLTLVGATVATTGQLSAPGGKVTLVAVPSVSFVQLGQVGQFLSVSPAANIQSTAPNVLSLTELVNTVEYDTGLTVTNNGLVELTGSGTQVPAAVGTTIVSGTLDASNLAVGQTGGMVQVLGDKVGLFDFARIDVSGDVGGGTALIGGDYQGQGEVPNATATYVGHDTTINSDAVNAGNGGLIVVWANESTRAYGALSAKGGAQAGNGGLIETSGRNFLDTSGSTVDASAPNGLGGTWLIDPRNVILSDPTSNGTFNGANPNIFTASGNDAVVFIPDIENQLNLGTNVIITTGSTGTQEGNITADDFGITKTTASPVTLTLQAANNITLSNFGINSNNGLLNILLQADSDLSGSGNVVLSNAGIQTSGGQFVATATGSVSLRSLGINSDYSGNGDAGAIGISADSVLLRDAGINSRTSGNGNAGQVTVNTSSLTLQDAAINSTTSGIGNAGSITLNSGSVLIEGLVNGSGINSTTSGKGNAETVTIIADSVTVRNKGGISSNAYSSGNGGGIDITAGSLSVENNSGINSETSGEGNAGRINITASSVLVENYSGLTTNTLGDGDAGRITLTADSVSLRNFTGINSNTSGEGNAGQITLKAGSVLLENNSALTTNTAVDSEGDAGQITITADSVFLEQDTAIDSETNGRGDGGIITISAANSISLRNDSDIFSNTNAEGDAGRVELNANSVLFENESGLGSITRGSGDAGTITIVGDEIVIKNNSAPATNTYGEGNAGRITLKAGSVLMENESSIISSAQPGSSGDAGQIALTADAVSLSRSSISTTVDANAIVNSQAAVGGGNIDIQARLLSLTNGAQVSANTLGQGNAGSIWVRNASEVSLSNSSISTAVNPGAVGQGGEIEIQSQSLSLTNQSALEAQSGGEGNAGNIQVNIVDAATLSEQSQITVSKVGTAGEAGNIDVSARSMSLDGKSQIIAETDSGEGGDIKLQTQDLLLLRNESQISTSAGNAQAGGDGGNITIDTDLLVPLENSDIIANAFLGEGGNIQITTQGLFLSPDSDITASSEQGINGVVEINTPEVDPSQGLVALPTDLVDASGLIAQNCPVGGGAVASEQSEFIVTGRGGLPPSPSEPLTSQAVWEDLRHRARQVANRPGSEMRREDKAVKRTPDPASPIVEAQGWVIATNGEVVLTAAAPTATFNIPWLPSSDCPAPEPAS